MRKIIATMTLAFLITGFAATTAFAGEQHFIHDKLQQDMDKQFEQYIKDKNAKKDESKK